ncbi:MULTISPECIES: isoprenylcysteine carboxylmethyltransferase family protein [unclassified Pseudomonas]|uniref:methyltransferase family protein n=1 Tax=unclassified Pseudomonas TaxID=196821 RepID=UPI0024485DF1|nr:MULTISPECIES: isoprenylcysteine carboxylmethyltransferase family protein [unclassified Pseudomonas]MDG9928023.1 isoprenylcysteine carboxylmethyltransferase family protein [Pseudomonas sp. GD04042]MDH0482032.1 isoprenylcysteine carboxylmethyltransferase family protein [Pseudomonas sp. GD04015]MDH0604073.1 isoprenylcysteine carboxylmethyltransferase family protein [Pseudomonas sp. GD03869]
MGALENRIPPPLVATLIGVLMWVSARYLPGFELAFSWRLTLTLPVLLLGASVCLAGVLSFHRARTTVNPLRPEKASTLVDSGIYRYTRNPMYLGFATMLMAWALALASPLAMFGLVAFVLYMNRFQIAPEERALAILFGDEFSHYCSRVRRWL